MDLSSAIVDAPKADPLAAVATFLVGIAAEAQRCDYHFDVVKIPRRRFVGRIPETEGQLLYEWGHLLAKLRVRAPLLPRRFRSITTPEPHPLFRIVPGNVRAWERR